MDLTELIRSSMSLCELFGVEASEMSAERVVLALAWRSDLLTSADLMHGGAVMALADAAGGACAFANLPEGAIGTSTIESKTNFLRGVREGDVITATAVPLHAGRSTIVIETEIRNADGKLVAKTTQTQSVLRAG